MDTMSAFSDSTTDYDIYTGVWTDWSRGKVFGATLTTTHTSGSLLIAFLSLFVTVVGTCFWRIGCFILHHIYSTESSRNALYHQRQAVLRNASNAATGLASLFQIFYAWRQARSSKAILPLIAFPVLTLLAFAVASTFSSRISTITGNAVLISSDNCGLTGVRTVENDTEWSQLFVPYLSQIYASSATYAQQCYVNPGSAEGCNKFVQRSLSAKITRNASCPFANDICKTQDSNILLDTGYLDNHDDFGLNTPPNQRFQYRRVMHCAPLVTEGYKEEVPNLRSDLPTPYMRYYYGHNFYTVNRTTNYTYQHPVLQKEEYKLADFVGPSPDFDLRIVTAAYINGSLDSDMTSFIPIPKLQVTNADTRLVFLSGNAVLFDKQVDDLWYSAHDLSGPTGHSMTEGLTDAYWSDEVSSPLACTTQHQYCNPNLEKDVGCTPLLGRNEAMSAAASLWQATEGEFEFDMYRWYVYTLNGAVDNLSLQLAMLGSSGLDSFSRKLKGEIGQLPDNQWQLDVEKWNNMSLALMQQNFVGTAAGHSSPEFADKWLLRPSASAEKQLCKNQKILSTAYTNFSVFGIAIIFGVGGLIILLSYTLEPFVMWIQRRRNLDVYSRLEWAMNETLQLQRLAHEELGLGPWSRCDSEVPITESRLRLAVLDLSDRTHPRLKAPPPSFENVIDEEAESEGKGTVVKEASVVSMAVVEPEDVMSRRSSGEISPLEQSDVDMGRMARNSRQSRSRDSSTKRSA